MGKSDAFRIALGRYGKPLVADRIHPDSAPGFEKFLKFFRNFL